MTRPGASANTDRVVGGCEAWVCIPAEEEPDFYRGHAVVAMAAAAVFLVFLIVELVLGP